MRSVDYARIGQHTVIQACEDYLEKRQRHLFQVREQLIQSTMNTPRRKWFFGKVYYLTRSQAWYLLHESPMGVSAWNLEVERTRGRAERVEALLKLAKHTDSPLWVSSDMAFLFKDEFSCN